MLDFLLTPLVFLFAISVLIAVHEFGHFWVARRMGVKVLRFSIGFGKPLWTRIGKTDGTEYVVAAVPLGGYVKMLDEREGEVAEEELGRAFNRQPIAKRFAIVSAGPVFNLLFAIVAYWAMFIHGTPGLKPLLGELPADSVAYQAGLRPGQEIAAVGGTVTPTWTAVLDTILPYALRKESVAITVRDGSVDAQYNLPLQTLTGELEPAAFIKQIGLVPFKPKINVVLERITSDSVAGKAGLKDGDQVVAVDGVAVADGAELVDKIKANPGRVLTFSVLREGAELSIPVRPATVETGAGIIGRINCAVSSYAEVPEDKRGNWQLGPLAAASAALFKTWDMAAITLRMMGEMVIGRASVENISGPITIAVYAKSSALAGLSQFLNFLAVVSVSLGVLNLLPVPILDGGHLMFYVVELIRGRPVTERTEALATKVGLTVILLLMTIALYNDMTRLIGG